MATKTFVDIYNLKYTNKLVQDYLDNEAYSSFDSISIRHGANYTDITFAKQLIDPSIISIFVKTRVPCRDKLDRHSYSYMIKKKVEYQKMYNRDELSDMEVINMPIEETVGERLIFPSDIDKWIIPSFIEQVFIHADSIELFVCKEKFDSLPESEKLFEVYISLTVVLLDHVHKAKPRETFYSKGIEYIEPSIVPNKDKNIKKIRDELKLYSVYASGATPKLIAVADTLENYLTVYGIYNAIYQSLVQAKCHYPDTTISVSDNYNHLLFMVKYESKRDKFNCFTWHDEHHIYDGNIV